MSEAKPPVPQQVVNQLIATLGRNSPPNVLAVGRLVVELLQLGRSSRGALEDLLYGAAGLALAIDPSLTAANFGAQAEAVFNRYLSLLAEGPPSEKC